jgi:sterol 14-demethylase
MLPPLVPGLPLVGNMPEFRRDPVKCIRAAHARHGPVFTLRLGPKRVVVMVGPQYHRLFYRETDRSLSTPEVYRFLIPMFGKVLGACPFAEYREHRRAIAPFFGKDFMAQHVGIMANETEALVAKLGPTGEFELWDVLEHLALTIAGKAVLGTALWTTPNADFGALFRQIARGMDYILPPNLPLPRFIRRNRARKALCARIKPHILRRRQGNGADNDLFQRLAEATDAEGRPLPLNTVAGLTLIMIHGAYETVAAQACWCLIHLLNRPEARRGIREEQDRVWDGMAPLTDATLERLPRLRSAVLESMRLRPAATVVCRYAAAPLQVGIYTIPVGSLVMLCPGVAHGLAEVFQDPAAYIADRFIDATLDSNDFVTFGGGMHRCMGSEFAIAEIMIMVLMLLRRFELVLDTPDPPPDYRMSVTRPASPCNVKYLAREPAKPPVAAALASL